MSNYNSKKDNEAQVFSFMDGVPVKISEKYKRPRKIVLPMGFQNRFQRDTAVDVEYDFHLENSIKSKIDEWQQAREQEIASRKEKLRLENEAAEAATAYVSPTSTCSTSNVSSTDSETNKPTLMSPSNGITTSCSTILTPVPISQPSASGHPSKVTSSRFNYSDFEYDTSSPFDSVELKTLNDMEELAHVLQSEAVSNTITEQYRHASSYQIENIPDSQQCHQIPSSEIPVKGFTPHVNGFTGAYNSSYALMEYRGGKSNINKNNNSFIQNNPNYDLQTQDLSITHGSSQSFHPSYSATATSLPQVKDTAVISSGNTLSKSVPDIVRELEKELSNQRITEGSSKTPPPRSNNQNNTGLEDWKPWPILDSPERTVLQKSTNSQLPNPFSDLSPSEQYQAKYISEEMGFALPKVARAWQMFGEEKLVIEFLLQVQSLEERGFSSDRSERALVSNEYNITQAAKHLDALHQLLDFGFPEDKIIETLLKCDNDRDKAVDILIS